MNRYTTLDCGCVQFSKTVTRYCIEHVPNMSDELRAIIKRTDCGDEEFAKVKASFSDQHIGPTLLNTPDFVAWLRAHKDKINEWSARTTKPVVPYDWRQHQTQMANCPYCDGNMPAGMDHCGRTACNTQWVKDHAKDQGV